MKRILITGASGFVGRSLCHYLSRKRKDYRIFGSDAVTVPDSLGRIEFLPAELCDPIQVRELIRRSKPDGIIHLAAQSVPQLSWKNIVRTFQVNVAGTIHLLNAIRESAPSAKFLLASSHQVYGKTFSQKTSVRETDVAWPENPYAASKLLAELACLNFHEQFGLQTVILRISNHAGKGLSTHFAFADWCRQVAAAEAGERPRILEVGNLDLERDFLHVEDVLRAYEILILKGKPGETYNVASGRTRKIRIYVDYILKSAKVPMAIEVQNDRLRRHDMKRTLTSSEKVRRLGWRPEISTFRAIDELLKEWRAHYKVS